MLYYTPDKILIEEDAFDLAFCRQILADLKNIKQETIPSGGGNKTLSQRTLSLTKGKKILHLKQFQGDAFKLCPGFSDDVLCCNYYVIDLIENCPLECTYCILQAFLNKPVITFHVNVEKIIDSMVREISKYPRRQFRIGTGEHSDSMALDHIFHVNPYLVETFSSMPNAVLELKTKTDTIDALAGLNHNERTVVSWSVNAPEIIEQNEFKTASLENRIDAASKVINEGYKVGFHFDPIIYYPEWYEGYKQTVEMIFDAVSPEHIAWISLGTLRYIPALKKIAEERFPKISIFSNEFISAGDGKMRYLKQIRKKMLGTLANWIQKGAPRVPLYLCMEKRSIWNHFMKIHPSDPLELERFLNLNI